MTPAQRRIDHDELLASALAVLDESGLSGFSMRLVATRLGVQAASLYGHVLNKQELLSWVSDSVLFAAGSAVDRTSWRAGLRSFAVGLRRELTRHPGAAAVVASVPASRAALASLESLVAGLVGALSLAPRDVLFAVQSLYVFTAGHALAQHGDPPAEPTASEQYYDAWFDLAMDLFLTGLAHQVVNSTESTDPAETGMEKEQ